MNYEQKYKEALERAKCFAPKWSGIKTLNLEVVLEEISKIFPELKESEDERIRKELINYLKDKLNSSEFVPELKFNSWITWLEKQKSTTNANVEDEIVYDNEGKIMLKAISEGICDVVGDYGWSDFGGIPTEDILAWLEKKKLVEWSEEDEKIKNTVIAFLDEFKSKGYENAMMCIDWLKSLRPQNHWKPTNEQMQALWEVYKGGKLPLAELYKDLENLKNN